VENKEGRLFDFVKKYLSARFVEDTYEHIAVKSFTSVSHHQWHKSCQSDLLN
jgi:hypothetical protein